MTVFLYICMCLCTFCALLAWMKLYAIHLQQRCYPQRGFLVKKRWYCLIKVNIFLYRSIKDNVVVGGDLVQSNWHISYRIWWTRKHYSPQIYAWMDIWTREIFGVSIIVSDCKLPDRTLLENTSQSSFLVSCWIKEDLNKQNISFAVFYGTHRSRLIMMSSVIFLIIVLQTPFIFWTSLRFDCYGRTSVVMAPVSCKHSCLLQAMHAAIWEQLWT